MIAADKKFVTFLAGVSALITVMAIVAVIAVSGRGQAGQLSTDDSQTSPSTASGDLSTDNTLLVISLDGFRADYLKWYKEDVQNITSWFQPGVTFDRMTPSFPSLTFPNHYTIATGMRPGTHGILFNFFTDMTTGEQFAMSGTVPHWWQGAEPIWATVEKANKKAYVHFWPGSEVPYDGVRPAKWYPYDGSMSFPERVEHVAEWLRQDSPPQLGMLYFNEPDHQGHMHGPASEQVRAAVRHVNDMVGLLRMKIEGMGKQDKVSVILLSDHGMAEASYTRALDFGPLDWSKVEKHGGGAQVRMFWPKQGYYEEVWNALQAAAAASNDTMQVFKKEEMPAKWGFSDPNNANIGPLISVVKSGWLAYQSVANAGPNVGQYQGGRHGYAPEDEEMGALLAMRGPAFKTNTHLTDISNLDMYNIMCAAIGISPVPNEGSITSLETVLQNVPSWASP